MTTLSEQYQDMISLGLSEKELREFREEKSRELHALGFQPKQIAEEFGYKEPDSEFPTDYWKKVSTAYNSEKKAKPGTMAFLQEQGTEIGSHKLHSDTEFLIYIYHFLHLIT